MNSKKAKILKKIAIADSKGLPKHEAQKRYKEFKRVYKTLNKNQ